MDLIINQFPEAQAEIKLENYPRTSVTSDCGLNDLQSICRFAEVPTLQSTMYLYPVDEAVHNVGESETDWNKRDARWSMVIVDKVPVSNLYLKLYFINS